jgi:hypothetical protein
VAQVARPPEAGDIMLFCGKGWSSDVVRLFTRSQWSHVGIVLRDPGQPGLLLLEANVRSDVADVRTGRRMQGVSLVSLAEKLDQYEGQAMLRRWCGPESVLCRREKVIAAADDLIHRPYCDFVSSWLRRGMRSVPGGMFCSELVAEIYRRAGWLPRGFNPARVVPAHFAGERLPLQNVALARPEACGSVSADWRRCEQAFA